MLTNNVTGAPYRKGETMYAPQLARTLEVVAVEGPEAFYTGSLAADIAADIQDAGEDAIFSNV